MSTMTDVVTFTVERALYGVPVDRVREILDKRPIAPMPNAPSYLLGIIDLRGDNIPVVDLRILLGLPQAEDTAQTRILVTLLSDGTREAIIGLRTDKVIEVTRLDEDILRPLGEAELLRWQGATIAGIGRRNGEVVSVIDLDNLFEGVPLGTGRRPPAVEEAEPLPEGADLTDERIAEPSH